MRAAQTAGALKFIEKGDFGFEDDTTLTLLKEMGANEAEMVSQLGKDKYDHVMDLLEKIDLQEVQRGQFLPIPGEIDQRPADLKIHQLPQNFNYNCGLRGKRLGSSQRSRVALARALVRNPSILMVDNVVDHEDLDPYADEEGPEADEDYRAGIMQGLQSRTGILVTNDMNLVQQCDRICVLEKGRVVMQGTWDDLEDSLHAQPRRGIQ